MLSHVRDPKRGDLPRVRELRSEQQKDALAFYLKVAGQDPDPDPEVRWDVAEARLDASLLQIQLGRPAEARDNLRRAEELLTGLREEHPDDVRFRRAHAETLTQLGFVTDGDEGRRYQGAALAEVEALVAHDPASESYRNDLARLCHAVGQRAQGANDPMTAERFYTRAIEVRRGLVAEHPDWRAQRLALAQTQVNLLLLRQSRVPFAELEPLATELIGTLEELAAADPNDPEALVALATVRVNWAYVLINRGAADEAEAGLGPAIAGLEAFLAREPEWQSARGTLLNARGTRGLVRERLGRYGAAAEDFRRVAELAPPVSRRESRVRVADFLIRDRQFAAAMAEAEAVTTDPAPVPHSGAVYQHLRNCAVLVEVGHWGYQPFRARAARAARALLDQGRQPPSAEWDEWLRAVRTDSVLAPLVTLPELRAVVGQPRP
jgi:tetratricopeptide (TPR) repeat protein